MIKGIIHYSLDLEDLKILDIKKKKKKLENIFTYNTHRPQKIEFLIKFIYSFLYCKNLMPLYVIFWQGDPEFIIKNNRYASNNYNDYHC